MVVHTVIPALGKWKEEDQMFKVFPNHIYKVIGQSELHETLFLEKKNGMWFLLKLYCFYTMVKSKPCKLNWVWWHIHVIQHTGG